MVQKYYFEKMNYVYHIQPKYIWTFNAYEKGVQSIFLSFKF